MSSDWVSQFVEALHALEDRGELEPLVAQFAPDAGLWNLIRSEPLHGTGQIREFWSAYRHQFDRIHSTFERTVAAEDQAALEWRAEGSLRGGQEISYRGVTVLERGPGGITQFASYFDPRPFATELSDSERTSQPRAARQAPRETPTGEFRTEEEIEEEAPSVMSYG